MGLNAVSLVVDFSKNDWDYSEWRGTMKLIKLISIALLGMLIIGCDGGGGGGSSSSAPSLADIAGVWDTSVTDGQKIDELYTVITMNGGMIGYDYMGDSADNGQNCYEKESSTTMKDLGNGKFLVVSGEGERVYVQISLSGNKLRITGEEGNEKFTLTWTRANLLRSDLTPLCSDSYYPPPIPDYGSY